MKRHVLFRRMAPDGRLAAVERQALAVEVGGCVAHQPDESLGDFLGLAEAHLGRRWRLLTLFLGHGGRALEHHLGHVGFGHGP